jgi:hypothetical protein
MKRKVPRVCTTILRWFVLSFAVSLLVWFACHVLTGRYHYCGWRCYSTQPAEEWPVPYSP